MAAVRPEEHCPLVNSHSKPELLGINHPTMEDLQSDFSSSLHTYLRYKAIEISRNRRREAG